MVKTCKSMLFCNGRRDPNSLIRSCDLSLSLWFLSFTVICFKYYSMLFSGLDKCNIFFFPMRVHPNAAEQLFSQLAELLCPDCLTRQDAISCCQTDDKYVIFRAFLSLVSCHPTTLEMCTFTSCYSKMPIHFDYLLKLFYVSV